MNDRNDGSSPARDRRRSSQVLREFKDTHTGERVALGELRDALGDRAFGVLLFIFSLPNLVPNIPGMSALFAIPLIFLSWQFFYGRPTPWFPSWLSERSFSREDFVRALDRGLPYLERFEKLLRPRQPWLFSWPGERALGLACLILAVVILLPIPLGNFLPSVSTAIIGLAVVERDGQAALIGLVIGIVAAVIVSGVVLAGIEFMLLLLERAFA